MISPHATSRGSLEYVFRGFGSQRSLTAAAVTVSRHIAEKLSACPARGTLKIFPLLSPAPSPSLTWRAQSAGRIPQEELSLTLAITISCLSPCALNPVAAQGVSLREFDRQMSSQLALVNVAEINPLLN